MLNNHTQNVQVKNTIAFNKVVIIKESSGVIWFIIIPEPSQYSVIN